MTNSTFNQLFDAYRQKVIETSLASFPQQPAESKPTWAQLLHRHVQEWKQHYGQQSQAIEQIRASYQQSLVRPGINDLTIQKAMLEEEEKITKIFQIKRDLIWERQQQELNMGKIII